MQWPNGYNGANNRQPRLFTVSLVSTLSSSLVNELKKGYDLVSGWKKKRKDPLTKTIPSRFFNFVTSMMTGIRLHDFNCGLKGYRKEVVKERNRGNRASGDTLLALLFQHRASGVPIHPGFGVNQIVKSHDVTASEEVAAGPSNVRNG